MNGAIVINGYLRGAKFDEPAAMMAAAAQRHGIGFKTLLNSDLSAPIGDGEALEKILGDTDFVVLWDKDVKLAMNLELWGMPVFNCAECIRLCDDKALTHLTLEECDIPTIRTFFSPMTFGMPFTDISERIIDQIGFPMVVKDCFGSFGQQVRLVNSAMELSQYLDGAVPRIFQEYIECGSEDIRIEVVGGKAVASVRRTAPDGDFRANATLGGTMLPYTPTDEERDLALEAADAVEADFAGVDIIRSPEGPLVCEVNSNAHIKNLLNCTGIDVSDSIIEHISCVLR